jgi:hypothetical protein
MHIASKLRRKRDEIEAAITAHEAKIEAARIDLAAIDKAILLFEPDAGRDETAPARELDAEAAARNRTQVARERIPGEFVYLNWP